MSQKNKWNINNPKERREAWMHALFYKDHNFINYFRDNLYEIAPGVYRGAQPTMGQLKKLRDKLGIKTIINLKHENRDSAYFLFEEERCKELGLKLVNVRISSRSLPSTEQLIEYKRVLEEEMDKPVLIHCKAGADRTSHFCTLYQYFIEKRKMKDTDQLRFFPYGYIKYSNAGVLKYYYDLFAKYEEENPDADLITWSKSIDHKKLREEFRANKLANFLYDSILRRE